MRRDVVVIPFPFTNLIASKKRPAVVLIDASGRDIVCAAITSANSGNNGVALNQGDFEKGGLIHPSFIQPTKLFTCEKNLVGKTVGTITQSKHKEVVSGIISLLR